MLAVEVLVSAILPVLLERLTSPELLQFLRQERLYSKIQTWGETLKMIQAVLGYAEEKQLEDKRVKDWLDDLQDLAYDVEDILDEFATEVLARKLEMENHDQTSSSKVHRKFVPRFFKNFSPKAIKFHSRMGSEIKDVKRRLEHVTSQLEQLRKLKDGLGLEKNIAAGTPATAYKRQLGTSIPIEPAIYGRDEDKAQILEMLFKDEPSIFNFHVISIVGMGGIGKTTLAQELYNDKAANSFELKAWVCISNDFDVLRISKAVLESITKSSNDLKDLNVVQIQLQKEFVGKKFLLVLDDIWSKDYSSWASLRSPFKNGASGSKIIVTTRNEDVALMMGDSTRLYRLKCLSDEDCWSLFKAHAFEDGVNYTHHDIQSIRQRVVEKSKGLPLASRILGGLLRAKQIDQWLEILNRKMWDFESEIPTTLKLSYFYLPAHLKGCFAHCAIFLEDYKFQEEEVIHLWIAEGLIQPSEEKELEDLGHEYFDDLKSRSFFQQASIDESKYIMHDLVNDLAWWASGATCFHLEDMSRANKKLGSLKKVRHLSFAQNHADGISEFNVISDVEHIDERLRTFLPLPSNHGWMKHYLPQTIISNLLPKFKKLRTLSLEDCDITELPESFGDLRHLRHFNLSGTRIKSLPESTSFLINLLILKLKGCYNLRKLPSKIRNLTKLRYLNVRGVSLDEMPLGINELECLQYLSDFIVGRGVGASLKDLKNLKSLYGELRLLGLSNVVDLQETSEMILNDKQKLRVLELVWHSPFDNTRNEEAEKKVLDLLHPHTNLEGLKIYSYCGIEFPSWVGDASFSKLTTVTLVGCNSLRFIINGQLPSSLKRLEIEGCDKLEYLWDNGEMSCTSILDKENNMSLLEYLRVGNCKSLTSLSLSGWLPVTLSALEIYGVPELESIADSFHNNKSLEEIDISNCKKLKTIPKGLYNLTRLQKIRICHCRSIVHFAEDGLPKDGLSLLSIACCEKLEGLPRGFHSLDSLKTLELIGCPSMRSFPKEGFPTNLTSLCIDGVGNLYKPLLEWGLHKLTSLTRLNLCGGQEAELSVLEQDMEKRLPDSLTSLSINEFPNVKWVLSQGLPSSLQSLSISFCPGVMSISELVLPSSLEFLSIRGCLGFTSSSKLVLPSSLRTVDIKGCPGLPSISEIRNF